MQKNRDQKLVCRETIESTNIECEELTLFFKNALKNEKQSDSKTISELKTQNKMKEKDNSMNKIHPISE